MIEKGLPVKRIRASALPLAFTCPGSLEGDLRVTESGPDAALGNAAHQAVRPLAESGEAAWDALEEIGSQWQCDPRELRILCALATTLWKKVEKLFATRRLTEVALEAPSGQWQLLESNKGDPPVIVENRAAILAGHVDIVSFYEHEAYLGDWKFGRKDRDYSQQMRGYMALVLLDNLALKRCRSLLLWVREQEAEYYEMSREGLHQWLEQLGARVLSWDGVYHPGPHCVYCPRSHDCKAHHALASRDLAQFVGADVRAFDRMDLEVWSPNQIVSLWHQARTVEHYAKRVQSLLRAHVEKVGKVETEDTVLRIVEEPWRKLLPLQAWPVLERHLSDEEMAKVIDISISAVEDVVRSKEQKGKKAAAVRALGEELAKAEAIQIEMVKKLKEEPFRQPPSASFTGAKAIKKQEE